MFCTLPPPRPSAQRRPPSHQLNQPNQSNQYQSCSQSYSQPDMSLYYSASAGCFHGSCLVTMADGTTKNVANIKQGDYVLCPSSTNTLKSMNENTIIVARVESILRTFSRFGVMNLVLFQNGLLATPWHPIKVNGKWTFPINTVIEQSENQNHTNSNSNTKINEGKLIRKMTEAVYSFLLGSEIVIDKNNAINLQYLEQITIAKEEEISM